MQQPNNMTIEEGKLRWHHGLGGAVALVLIFSLVIGYVLPSYLPFSEAATYTFVQSSWAGGADATATSTHASNRTGWTKYESASSSVATSTELTIAADQNSSTTETSTADFNSSSTSASTTVSN